MFHLVHPGCNRDEPFIYFNHEEYYFHNISHALGLAGVLGTRRVSIIIQ